MAGCDYLSCALCGCKTIYDAEVDYEIANIGNIAGLCKACSERFDLAAVDKATNELTMIEVGVWIAPNPEVTP